MNTKKQFVFPTIDGAQDPSLIRFQEQLGQQLTQYLRNVYLDLVDLQFATPVDNLPTASAELRGRILTLKGGTGVQDSLKICIKNAADSYEWKTITVS